MNVIFIYVYLLKRKIFFYGNLFTIQMDCHSMQIMPAVLARDTRKLDKM
jgi:hypothetical protein